jgi:hypothetical protein
MKRQNVRRGRGDEEGQEVEERREEDEGREMERVR